MSHSTIIHIFLYTRIDTHMNKTSSDDNLIISTYQQVFLNRIVSWLADPLRWAFEFSLQEQEKNAHSWKST